MNVRAIPGVMGARESPILILAMVVAGPVDLTDPPSLERGA
jgi:hypothetical protein